MKDPESLRQAYIFAGLMLCSVMAAPAAGQSLPPPVTVITSLPPPAADAFFTNIRFGPDGLIYAWDGQQVWRQSGVNVNNFGAVAIGTVPSTGADAGPINFSQNGQTLLVGNGAGGQDFSGASNGLLYAMSVGGGAATLVGALPYHQDFIPVPAAASVPNSETKFVVDVGHSDFATSELDLFDYTTGKSIPLIQNIPGASSSIALDSANRLYVGIGFGTGVRGQIRRFTLPLLDFAAGGRPLAWTNGQLFNAVDNNGGAGMFFDARGNLFVGGPNGVAVFSKNGASQLYGTGTSSFPAVMGNAAHDQLSLTLAGFNDPMNLGFSPRIYNAADFNVPTPPAAKWNVPTGGNWSAGGNWDQSSAPNGADQWAVLDGGIGGSQTISLDVPVTLGTLTFKGSQRFLVNGPSTLTMQVSGTIATINVDGGSHEIAASLTLTSDTDVTVTNAGDSLTLSGAVGGSGMLSKEGRGTLVISGASSRTGNVAVDGGTLRFQLATGPATVATGTTVSIAAGATLEFAGAISALGTAGGTRAQVINDSTASGLLVTGHSQVVGGIDGGGATTIGAGSDLTVDHIIQSALAIGGDAMLRGTLTIAASDAAGDPMVLAGSFEPGAAFSAAPGLDEVPAVPFDGAWPVGVPALGANDSGLTSNVVPEPTSLILALTITATLVFLRCRRGGRNLN